MFTLVTVAVMLRLSAPGHAAPQVEPPAAAESSRPMDRQATRAERLSSLRPDAPLEYFELAEELLADPLTVDDREIARRLFVLALVCSHRSDAGPRSSLDPDWLPASACLALASIAQTEQERRWLRAVAGTLAPADARLAVQRQHESRMVDSAAIELSGALGALRFGDGRRAAKILEKPEVAALLLRYERLLSPGGLPGGAARVRALIDRHPACPECRNRRFVKDKEGVHLCPSCGGRPGPALENEELVGQLRLESLLLNGVQRSWAAQVVADDGAPLRELDVASVTEAYQVDPAKVVWRDGRWAEPLSTAPPAPPSDDR